MINFSNLPMTKVIMLVALAVAVLYLVRITEPVPNYDKTTGKIVYASDAPAVVPNNVTGFHAAIIIGLAVMLTLSEQQGRRKINVEQAEKIAVAEADRLKKKGVEDFNGKIIPGTKFLKNVILQNQSIPFRWFVGITIKMQDVENYFHVEMDSEGIIEGVVARETSLSQPDMCANCGKMAHIKKIMPQELAMLREMRGAMGQR